MNANSNHLRRYSTPRRLQPIDPDAFYAVDSCVLGLPQRVPEPFTRPERRGASGNKLGLRLQRNPPCATEWTTIMQEEEYNKRQPTHTYQQPLIPTAAPVPGSIFNRHGGSKSNRRGHHWSYIACGPVVASETPSPTWSMTCGTPTSRSKPHERRSAQRDSSPRDVVEESASVTGSRP